MGPTIEGNVDQTDPSDRMSSILSGSVFLITSEGRTLHLPTPSPSPSDPLNWSLQKRVSALAPHFFFTIVGLTQMQGAGVLLVALEDEYAADVCVQ
jgi:hypothetical protein